jgi:hypothetical protein
VRIPKFDLLDTPVIYRSVKVRPTGHPCHIQICWSSTYWTPLSYTDLLKSDCDGSTAELNLSGHCLCGLPIIRTGLVLPSKFLDRQLHKTNLPRNNRLSDQVQHSVMACRTSNQAWSKGFDAGTYCKSGVTGIFHWHKILPIALWPGVDSPSNRNEYQGHFLGVKAAVA